MQTFIIPASRTRAPRSQRLRAVLWAAVFSMVLILANLLIFPRAYLNGNVAGAVVVAGVVGMLLAVTRGWGSGRVGKPLRSSELQVSDNEMTRVFYLRFNRLRRTVRKGRVKTVKQRDMPFDGKGMFVSERAPSWAFAFAGVLIPESLPNYRELCELAESWKAH